MSLTADHHEKKPVVTAEEIAVLRGQHTRSYHMSNGSFTCDYCRELWPCPVVRLCDEVKWLATELVKAHALIGHNVATTTGANQ